MKRHTWISLLTLACWSLTAASPVFAQWHALGLSGLQAVRLRTHAGFLYACTDDGLHRLSTESPDSLWSLVGFAGHSVLDLAVLGPQTLLAAKALTAASWDTVSLFRSTDGGGSWHPFQNGFGAGSNRQARRLLAAGSGAVFAANSRIEKSTNGGLSWRVVAQAQVLNALEGSPADPQLVWAGGETVIFSPYVLKSSDGGETWKQSNLSAGGDNAVDAIAAHPLDPNVVYLGMEGRVMKSENGGTSWSTVTSPDPSLYTFGMAIRPFPPLKVFAAGASFTPAARGVVFHQSLDGGESWQAGSYPADAGLGVLHLLLAAGAVEETLYVATYNGVYRHTHSPVGVPLSGSGALTWRCRPNPFGSAAIVEFELPAADDVSLSVLDGSGRKVATLVRGPLPSGPHRIRFDASGLKAGVYFGRLEVGGRVAALRLLHRE